MQQQPQIDLKNSTSVEGFDGGVIFQQGFILRKISKFILGQDEDALVPIPIFYDISSKKIIVDSLPHELRDEYKDYSL
jgi:hypothetical protein